MYREIHSQQRNRTASAAPRTVRRAAPFAALVLAVLLAVLVVAGPVAAADDAATYKLIDIKKYYVPGENPTADASVRIDDVQYDSKGGSIAFTHRSIATSGDCVGKVQHFKFSWVFNKDVSTFSGREGDPLVVMSTKWEGDGATPCLDENPFVWINSGGKWGEGPNDAAADYLFKLDFANPNSGENRVYFKGDTKSSPTISFNRFITDTGAISIVPVLRIPYSNTRGPGLSVVYVYQKVPDAPTNTATTAPQTTVATTTTAPGGTAVPGTGGGSGCSWTGTWSTEWGQMTLTQSGNRVAGTYDHDAGRIEGTVSGDTFTARWSESPSYTEPNDAGQTVMTMAPGCDSFTGTWGYGSASTGGSWTGTKTGATVMTTAPITTTVPTTTITSPRTTTVATTTATTTAPTTTATGSSGGCSWSGTWSTSYGEMVLSQSGNLVTGTYPTDNGVIEGTVSGNTLTGRWSESPSYKAPNDAGQFSFTMASDCNSFSGTWGYGGESAGGSWTGTRGGTSGTAATTSVTTRTTAASTTTSTGGSSSTARNGCPATGMLLYIDPWTPSPGQTIEIPVWCCNAQDLANMDLTVLYDPAVLTFVSARKGGLLGSDFLFESNDLGGQIKISFAGTRGVSGSGAIAILTFKVAGATGSSTTIGATVNTASTTGGTKVTVPTQGGTVSVKPPNPQNPEGRPCGPTSLTALKALQMAVGKIPMDMAYDITRDGTVNSADARELLRLATEEVCVI